MSSSVNIWTFLKILLKGFSFSSSFFNFWLQAFKQFISQTKTSISFIVAFMHPGYFCVWMLDREEKKSKHITKDKTQSRILRVKAPLVT